MADPIGYVGTMERGVGNSDASTIEFIVRRVLGRSATIALVRVESVRAGDVGPVGYCDVVPMVHQVAGDGNAWPHSPIRNVPYLRLQGGANAVILDPRPGDIGLACFCSEDISRVKQTKAPALPGSRRRFSMGDALYLGGVLNGTPTNYIRLADDGITMAVSGLSLHVTSTGFAFQGGAITHNGVPIGATHEHSGITTGAATSGPPVP